MAGSCRGPYMYQLFGACNAPYSFTPLPVRPVAGSPALCFFFIETPSLLFFVLITYSFSCR